jgi:hypothetical protein
MRLLERETHLASLTQYADEAVLPLCCGGHAR